MVLFLNNMYTQTNPLVVIANDDMNDVFIGVDNPITIVASGMPCEALRVEITNGTITGDCGRYKVFVKGEVDTTIIKAFSNNGLLATKTFKLKKLPDPKAYLLGKTSGFIYKKELVENHTMKAFFRDFRFEIEFEVIGFELTYKHNGQTLTHQSNSNTLTTEMMEALDDLYRDQLIEFKKQQYSAFPDSSNPCFLYN